MDKIRPLLKYILPVFSLLVLAVVLTILHRALAGYHLRDVYLQLREIPVSTITLASLMSLASYLVLSCYDLLALRYVNQSVKVWRAMLAGFLSFAVGHNVGYSTLSGAAIRLRIYGAVGVPVTAVALMSGFCGVTTALGSTFLIAYVLLTQAAEATVLLHISTVMLHTAGSALMILLLAYCVWVSRQLKPLQIRQWKLKLPGIRLTVLQIVVAALDLCLAAACLYVLLPGPVVVSYQTFLAIYVLTLATVLVANVPGGLGVLESVIVLALPQLPVDRLLASLVAFRIIYYLCPLILAALSLAVKELWLHRHRANRVTSSN